MAPSPANHTRCASCGGPHNQWPALDEAGGDLCDACFADQADDDWFTTSPEHPHALDNPRGAS